MKETFLPEEAPVDDGKFRKIIGGDRRSKGAWAEAVVIADLLDKGYVPSVPSFPVAYDLVVDRNGELLRVQVKLGSSGATMQAMLGWTSFKYNYAASTYEPVNRLKYDETSFDILAVVDRKTREVFYVPKADIDFNKTNFTFNRAKRDRYKDF